MADPANKLTVVVEQIAIRVDSGHWNMLSWLDLWDVIELLVVTLSVGFALGYMCAVRFERVRTKNIPGDAEMVVQSTSVAGTKSKRALRRTLGTQAQCTYKRKRETPRVQVVPPDGDGVFDVSFSEWRRTA